MVLIESQASVSLMTIDEIYQYFADNPPTYINKEQAVCYILSVLLQGDSYGVELIQKLAN